MRGTLCKGQYAVTFAKRTCAACAVLAVIAMLLAAVQLPQSAYAADRIAQVDGIYYTLHDDGTASVGRQKKSGTSFAVDEGFHDQVVVPEAIAVDSESYAVTAVNAYAFSDGSGADAAAITALSLPASVTSVGEYALTGCKQLASLTFEKDSRLAMLGQFALAQCTELEQVAIPRATQSVGSYCFYNCLKLSEVRFEDEQATIPSLRFDSCAFASSSAGGALEHVTLPARTEAISVKMFQNQGNLRSVDILAESLTSIASLAFDCCASLEEIRIPELTTAGSTPIGTRAFRGCSSLKTVVFLADVDYELDATVFSSSEMLTTYAATPLDIENVVYCASVSSVLFPDTAKHYYRVNFYAEQDAMAQGEQPLSWACIRDDVPLSSIKSTMEASDAKGAVVFEGDIPELSSCGAWMFEGHSQDGVLSNLTNAYMVDDYNLANARFAGTLSYPYTNKAVKLEVALVTAGNVRLKQGSDYSLTVTNAQGKAVAISRIVKPGVYTLVANPPAGSQYAGTAYGSFEIVNVPVAISRITGSSLYATLQKVIDASGVSGRLKTVIVTSGKDTKHSLAVSGLAGAMGALVLQTDPKRLSAQTKTVLRALQPKQVIVVGGASVVSKSVASQIKTALPASSSVSRLSGANNTATSAALYMRTKQTGVWSKSKACIIVAAGNVANAAAIAPYAYATKSPVFLVKSNKKLSANVKKAIKQGKFKKVVLVGKDKEVSKKKIKKSLKMKGVSYKRLGGKDAYAVCLAIAKYALSTGVLSCDKAVVASPTAKTLALQAVDICGMNASVLLYASAKNTAALSLLAANRYNVFDTYVLGSAKNVPASVVSKLAKGLKK